LFQTADRVCCKGVSGLEFRVPQGFCFKEWAIYNGEWLKVIHQAILSYTCLCFKSFFLEKKTKVTNFNSIAIGNV
jgi:hypothetical protein